MKLLKRAVYFILILLLFAVSFLHFSSAFFPDLNSDDALRILMIPTLELPNDLYCWGQNYGGSLLQILAWPLYHIGMPAYWADSVMNYLLLFVGYYFFTIGFRTRTARLVFAMLWFLPPLYLNSLLRYPVGMQFCTLAPASYCALLVFEKGQSLGRWRRALLAVLVAALFIVSVWTYDYSLIFIILLMVWLPAQYLIKAQDKGHVVRRMLREPALWLFLVLMGAGLWVLALTRNLVSTFGIYEKRFFSTPHEMFVTAGRIISTSRKVLMFDCGSVFMSIWGWLALILFMCFVVALIRNFRRSLEVTNAWFFIVLAIAGLVAIIVSRWVYEMELARRYFVVIYVPLSIAFLMFSEHLGWLKRRILRWSLSLIMICGALSSMSYFYYPKYIGPRVDVAAEFSVLAPAGIISEYWNAYIAAVHNPEGIIATPHDKDFVRIEQYPDKVMEQPRIYLIRDNWIETFPDTIIQFGRMLKRSGAEFVLGSSYLCPYIKVPYSAAFTVAGMFHKYCFVPETDTGALCTDTVTSENAYICTPAIQLGPGTYIATWELSYCRIPEGSSLHLQITDRLQQTPLAETIIGAKDINLDDGQSGVALRFTLTQRVKFLECHIFIRDGFKTTVKRLRIKQV